MREKGNICRDMIPSICIHTYIYVSVYAYIYFSFMRGRLELLALDSNGFGSGQHIDYYGNIELIFFVKPEINIKSLTFNKMKLTTNQFQRSLLLWILRNLLLHIYYSFETSKCRLLINIIEQSEVQVLIL